jgi:hypothetical protein
VQVERRVAKKPRLRMLNAYMLIGSRLIVLVFGVAGNWLVLCSLLVMRVCCCLDMPYYDDDVLHLYR